MNVLKPSFTRAEVLLVAELGTDWARWMDELGDQGTAFNAIIQSPRETAAAFARRVSTRVATLAAQERLPSTVLLVQSSAWDDARRAARKQLASAVAGRLAHLHEARLVVACDLDASRDSLKHAHDFTEDLAVRYSGIVAVEHAKRYTTVAPVIAITPNVPLPAA